MSFGKSPEVFSVVPKHVAIVMDGNGRWAKKRFFPRVEGHRAGAKSVRTVVEESRKLGIRYLTLFAFSSENWQRPKDEVSSLMRLFAQYLESELQLMLKNDIRLRSIGDLERLPLEVQQSLNKSIAATAKNSTMDLVLAVSYGSRDEIVAACQKLAKQAQIGQLRPEAIDSQMLQNALYAPDIPDPDLLIRTSGESRISNFLLWQLAYSEIVVSPVLWPDFDSLEYHRCLQEYAGRTRRFGLTDEQLNQA